MATLTQAISDDLTNNILTGDWVISGGGDIYARHDSPGFAGAFEFRSGQKLVIMAGTYGDIRFYCGGSGGIDDSPGLGEYGVPFIITNGGGQVVCDLLEFDGLKNAKITGKYDPVRYTGHTSFRGHKDAYTNSSGTYGIQAKFILINKDQYATGNAAAGAGGGLNEASRDIEIEFIESFAAPDEGFATLQVKNDNLSDADAYMGTIRIHDCYLHDSYDGELYYGGSTSGFPQSTMKLLFYNNRLCRASLESLQAGRLAAGSRIFNNVMHLAGLSFLSAFQAAQDNNTQFNATNGDIIFENNLIIGAAVNSMIVFGQTSDTIAYNGLGIQLRNNAFLWRKNLGMYNAGAGSGNAMPFEFNGNYFGFYEHLYDRLDNSSAYTYEINGSNLNDLFTYMNNKTAGSTFVSATYLANANIEQINTTTSATIQRPIFVESGFNDATINWNHIERWYATVGTTGSANFGDPITYPVGWHVIHHNKVYLVTAEATGIEPEVTSGWESYYTQVTFNGNDFPTDDLRLVADNFYNLKGIGLLDNMANSVTQYKWQEAEDDSSSPDVTTIQDIPGSNVISLDVDIYRIPSGKWIRSGVLVRSQDDRQDSSWKYTSWYQV